MAQASVRKRRKREFGREVEGTRLSRFSRARNPLKRLPCWLNLAFFADSLSDQRDLSSDD